MGRKKCPAVQRGLPTISAGSNFPKFLATSQDDSYLTTNQGNIMNQQQTDAVQTGLELFHRSNSSPNDILRSQWAAFAL